MAKQTFSTLPKFLRRREKTSYSDGVIFLKKTGITPDSEIEGCIERYSLERKKRWQKNLASLYTTLLIVCFSAFICGFSVQYPFHDIVMPALFFGIFIFGAILASVMNGEVDLENDADPKTGTQPATQAREDGDAVEF